MSKLFSPYQIKNVTLKNRIVMSPMCMHSAKDEDGTATEWHKLHYGIRAVGQAGLIMLESTSVHPHGRVSFTDLGIWDDKHIEGLRSIVNTVHENGSKIAIQLCHSGRKAVGDSVIGPSPIAHNKEKKTPKEMSIADIKAVVEYFKIAALRCKEAGFDLIELHGAHGYLISSFLSPLSNKRTDQYGGSRENRYRFLREVIEAINTVWRNPLFVRLSVNEYHPAGNSIEDFIYFSQQLKSQGVDLVDCSSGGVVLAEIDSYPGYQVPLTEKIKKEADIATGAVGLITNALLAEEILKNNRADLIFIGRELLRDPFWPLTAAHQLGEFIQPPFQYDRAWKEMLIKENSSIIQRWVPGHEALAIKL